MTSYRAGDHFGEIALLIGEPRRASVYALGGGYGKGFALGHNDGWDTSVSELWHFLELAPPVYRVAEQIVNELPITSPWELSDTFLIRRKSYTTS